MSLRCNRPLRYHFGVSHVADTVLAEWGIDLCARLDSAPAAGETFALSTKGGLDSTTKANHWMVYQNSSGTYRLQAGYWSSAGASVTLNLNVELEVGRWFNAYAFFDGTDLVLAYALRATAASQTAPTAWTASTSSTPAAGPHVSGTADWLLGASVTSASVVENVLSGCITEVRLFGAGISLISEDNRLGTRLEGDENDLVAYLRCDDGMGGWEPLINDLPTVSNRTQLTNLGATFRGRPTWADDPADLLYDIGSHISYGFLGWHSWTMRPETTITVSSADAAYPATNLYNPRQEVVCKSNGAVTSWNAVFDFGSPVPIWAFSLHNSGIDDEAGFAAMSAYVLVQLNSADSWSPGAVEEEVTYHPDRLLHIFDRPYTYRYARVNLTCPSGVVQAGCIHWWAGLELLEPAEMADAFTVQDQSVGQPTRHGGRTSEDRKRTRTYNVGFPQVRRAQAAEMRRAWDHVGGGMAPVLLLPDAPRSLYPAAVYGFARQLPTEQLGNMPWTHADVLNFQIEMDEP